MFCRYVFAVLVPTDERMPIHAKKLKYADCQAKGIVVCRSDDLLERFPLKLRWCVLGNANVAEEAVGTVRELEAVRVDEDNSCVWRNEDATLIDIANDTPGRMDVRENSGDIDGHTNDELVIRFWEVLLLDPGV